MSSKFCFFQQSKSCNWWSTLAKVTKHSVSYLCVHRPLVSLYCSSHKFMAVPYLFSTTDLMIRIFTATPMFLYPWLWPDFPWLLYNNLVADVFMIAFARKLTLVQFNFVIVNYYVTLHWGFIHALLQLCGLLCSLHSSEVDCRSSHFKSAQSTCLKHKHTGTVCSGSATGGPFTKRGLPGLVTAYVTESGLTFGFVSWEGDFDHSEQSYLRAYWMVDKHPFEGRLSICIMEQHLTQLT